MKKVISVILFFVLMLGNLTTEALASSESGSVNPRMNNATTVQSSFTIDEGIAKSVACYVGYLGVTTGATVTVKLQKRRLLVIWNDVTEWVDVSNNHTDEFVHTYSVDSGTYRVQITYEIRGTGGATDVIEEEIKKSY